MEEWISAKEASKLLNCNTGKFYREADKLSLETKKRYILGKRCKHFLLSDVVEIKSKWNSIGPRTGAHEENPIEIVSDIVRWADSLAEWPSHNEIESMVAGKYKVKDIVSVIEQRPARGVLAL